MFQPPSFPDFIGFELEHRDFVQSRLSAYTPETSELTFTNLFIWCEANALTWSMLEDRLVVVSRTAEGCVCCFGPIGPEPRVQATRTVLAWLAAQGEADPRIERADARLMSELVEAGEFVAEPAREHFDYVYLAEKLVSLSGRKLHPQKNHVNRFKRAHEFAYLPLDDETMHGCFELLGKWCDFRICQERPGVKVECEAAHLALAHHGALGVQGGVIVMDGAVQAFALGEMLNAETAVIHIEKADPENHDLFAVINQQFCEHCWADALYVNREQDLGDEHLRQTKLSYHPERLVEKYTVRPAGGRG